jgi:hypothetical protein
MPRLFQHTSVTLADSGSSARTIRETLFATTLVPAQEAGRTGAGDGCRSTSTNP